MMEPYRFKSEDKIKAPVGREGVVYTFSRDQMPEDIWEPNDLVGLTVEIDGVKRVVKGVEACCIGCSPRSPYRLEFALLTDE